MSSSSSLHRNSPRIVPVLFLIAMDEQTVSLILPYQRANWLPQNSPELSQPAACAGDGGFVHIWRGKDSSPQGWMQVFGGEKQSMNSGVLGKHKDRMQRSKDYHIRFGPAWFRQKSYEVAE